MDAPVYIYRERQPDIQRQRLTETYRDWQRESERQTDIERERRERRSELKPWGVRNSGRGLNLSSSQKGSLSKFS